MEMLDDHESTRRSSSHSSIELQIAVLRTIPIPILVLSPSRTAFFANRAAARLLRNRDPLQAQPLLLHGRSLDDLGVVLESGRSWNEVLDDLEMQGTVLNATGFAIEKIEHEVRAVMVSCKTEFGVNKNRILLSTVTTGDGMHYILCFEQCRRLFPKNEVDDEVLFQVSEPSESQEFADGPDPTVQPEKDTFAVTNEIDQSQRLVEGLAPVSSKQPIPEYHVTVMDNSKIELRDTTAVPLSHLLEEKTDSNILSQEVLRLKKAVFDSCTTAGFIVSNDLQRFIPNEKFREVIGESMGNVDGIDCEVWENQRDVWTEDFSRQVDPKELPARHMLETEEPFFNYRCGFIHNDTGEKITMSVRGECLYNDEGKVFGGIMWCHDFQEYSKFLDEEQKRRLNSHETICNLMPHLVWTTTPDGECDWFSDAWYSFTGMTREESLGSGYLRAVHPDDIPVLVPRWKAFVAAGQTCECEVRYLHKEGNYRWTLCRAVPYRDEHDQILKWYGTNTDIHDLVVARIDAAQNKMQMLTVLAHAEVYLFSVNKDRIITMAEGGLLWVNQGESIHDKSSLIGQDIIEVSRSAQEGGIPCHERNILNILEGKVEMASYEDRIAGRVYRTRLVAELEHNVVDGAKKPEVRGVLGLTIDVTDMKARAQLELDNTRLVVEEQAAKDSNRMKSQFLANMSHELRTPTAGVIGLADLLSEDPNLSHESREYVNSIRLSAKALLTIVNDILDFSKIESGRLDIEEVPFNLSETVGELCKLLSMFAQQKNLDFVYENTMDEDLEVLGDSGRIRQVLSNLLTNALKFTTHGSVKISVSSKSAVPQMIADERVDVTFVIEDTGIGIEKHVLDKLFVPFRQGDASTARLYGGTGLGLTISKNLATLMNGTITLTSKPNVGSTSTFTIPLKISSWSRGKSQLSSSPPHPGFRYQSSPHDVITVKPSQSWNQPLTYRPVNHDTINDPEIPPQPLVDPSDLGTTAMEIANRDSLLNQQISSSVTSYSPPGNVARLARSHSYDQTTSYASMRGLSQEERSKVHILVVEDNAINQTIAIKTIRKLGFPVSAVWNGREALSYLLQPSTSHPRPDIILMDVQMPVMDGYEATKILRTGREFSFTPETPATSADEGSPSSSAAGARKEVKVAVSSRLRDIPVIAMTASAIQGDAEKCREAGMDDYLSKPAEKVRLEEMLVKWARRKRNAS